MKKLLLLASVAAVFGSGTCSYAMEHNVKLDMSYVKGDRSHPKYAKLFKYINDQDEIVKPEDVKTVCISKQIDIPYTELMHYFYDLVQVRPHSNVKEIQLDGTKVNLEVISQMTYVFNILRPANLLPSCLANSVKILDLSNTSIGDAALEPLGKWTRLETLKLRSTECRVLHPSIRGISTLKSIDLQSSQASVGISLNLPPDLTILNISKCNSFSATDFSFLPNFKSIIYVDLSETYFSDSRYLPENLQELACYGMKGDVLNAYYFPLTVKAINGITLPTEAKYIGIKLEQITKALKSSGTKIENCAKPELKPSDPGAVPSTTGVPPAPPTAAPIAAPAPNITVVIQNPAPIDPYAASMMMSQPPVQPMPPMLPVGLVQPVPPGMQPFTGAPSAGYPPQ